MKEIISGLSLLFLIQGVGGLINYLTNGGKSWFLVNYIDAFQGLEIVINIVFIIVGGGIGLASRKVAGTTKKES
ncbi:hypothetical protein [Oceanobacillus sp. J11TS1]|uniref:hypothetical protein n=1 Tax=Oceanobacillus sp. J11TS1 TaxID=2807191 RepID=UPI001B1BF701|nr:hypothetical protein [Oceanobacillus sp. J11TS1]GIO22864.1 hypothetical protein J11TS1_14450 [Oceanobacillus sp. J11TS1]